MLRACAWVGFIAFYWSLTSCAVGSSKVVQYGNEAMLTVELKDYPGSSFKQVRARLLVPASRALVFRVLANIKHTPRWFDRLQSMQNLAFYDVNHFLVQALLESPWPFKNREIISCVDTAFEATVTRIDIRSCSLRQPVQAAYLRVERAESSWVLSELEDGRTLIEYRAWLEPGGNVPALFFNWNLRASTAKTLQALAHTLALSKRDDFAY